MNLEENCLTYKAKYNEKQTRVTKIGNILDVYYCMYITVIINQCILPLRK